MRSNFRLHADMNRSRHNVVALIVPIVVGAAVVATPFAARADIDSPLVRDGVKAYAALDYQRAIALLEQARNDSLTREEKIATYRTLGMAYVAVGQPGPAKIHFQHLLRIDPTVELDRSVAPKVRAVFEEAKGEAATSAHAMAPALPSLSPSVEPAAPKQGRPVTVHVVYPGGVARKMTVYFRKPGDAQFSREVVAAAPSGA